MLLFLNSIKRNKKKKEKTDYEHEGATSYSTGSIRLAHFRTVWRKELSTLYSVYTEYSVDPIKSEHPKKAFLSSQAKHRSEVSPLDDHGPNPTSFCPEGGSLAFAGRILESRHIGTLKQKWGAWGMGAYSCRRLSRCAVLVGMFPLCGWLPSSPQGWVDRLQTFQFPIRSLDNSRCFFESIVESIFDCTGKYADPSCRWIFTFLGGIWNKYGVYKI